MDPRNVRKIFNSSLDEALASGRGNWPPSVDKCHVSTRSSDRHCLGWTQVLGDEEAGRAVSGREVHVSHCLQFSSVSFLLVLSLVLALLQPRVPCQSWALRPTDLLSVPLSWMS